MGWFFFMFFLNCLNRHFSLSAFLDFSDDDFQYIEAIIVIPFISQCLFYFNVSFCVQINADQNKWKDVLVLLRTEICV